jgi:hypothetical protein
VKVQKLARFMEAWRWGFDTMPGDVARWIMPLGTPGLGAVLVSPRAGTAHGPGSKAGTVIEAGWYIVRAETGCLYAVSNEDFRKKYRPVIEDLEPPASAPAVLHTCWPASSTQH